MRPLLFFLGRALQVLGLATMTIVVGLFFMKFSMQALLTWSLIGAVEFYVGTGVLEKWGK